jgi:RNase P subunit RPR2
MEKIKSFKCPHCNTKFIIPFNELIKLANEGKIAKECEACEKLFTIREDEKGIFIG